MPTTNGSGMPTIVNLDDLAPPHRDASSPPLRPANIVTSFPPSIPQGQQQQVELPPGFKQYDESPPRADINDPSIPRMVSTDSSPRRASSKDTCDASVYSEMQSLQHALNAMLPRISAMIVKDQKSHLQMSLQASYPIIQQLVFCLDATAPIKPSSHTQQVGEGSTRRTYDSVMGDIYGESDIHQDSQGSANCVDIGSARKNFKLTPEGTHDVFSTASSTNNCYIHPEKPLRLFLDFCSMVLILTLMIVIPIEIAFYWKYPPPYVLEVIGVLVDIFFVTDIGLSFCTAYHQDQGVQGRLVTDFKSMALKYAKGWMMIDVLATMPYSRIFGFFQSETAGGGGNAAGGTKMLRVMRIAKVARIMKVLRVLKLGGLMQTVEERLVTAQSMTVAFQLAKMTLVMLLLCHQVACVWYAVAALNESGGETWLVAQKIEDSGGMEQYVAAFYFAITTGTTVGYGDIAPVNSSEQACTAVLLILSVGCITQFLGKVSVVISSLRHQDNMTAQSKREALLFMVHRGIPKELQSKVLRFIEHTNESLASTKMDEKLMSCLSASLQGQLALAVAGKVLKQFPLFADLGDGFLGALCRIGHTQRAACGELVVTEEQPAHEMFWLVSGEATAMRKGRVLTTLHNNDWFGELVLFFSGVVRSATIRCETHCDFFVLHHDQFHQTMHNFRHVRHHFDVFAEELQRNNLEGLKRKCALCGSTDHKSDDCPDDTSSRATSPRSPRYPWSTWTKSP